MSIEGCWDTQAGQPPCIQDRVLFAEYPTLPQRKWAHQEPSGTSRTREHGAVVVLEPGTYPVTYYLSTTNKTSQQLLAHFKTKGRPLLPLYRLGTSNQLYKHATYLTVLRTQQMLHTHTKKIYPPRLSRENQKIACPPLPLVIRVYTSMPLLPGAAIPCPSLPPLLPAPTLSSNFNNMSSFCCLRENSFKETHFYLQRWTLGHLTAQEVPSPERKVRVPAL